MGCLRSARALSWFVSISFPYVPAWIIAAGFWHAKIFTTTNIGTLIGINLVAGFSISSWSIFVATFFGNSPQLSAICTTGIGFVSAILAMIFGHSSFAALIFTLLLPPSFLVFALRSLAQEEQYQKELADAVRDGYSNEIWLDVAPTEFSLGIPMLFGIISILLYPCLALWLDHLLYDPKPAPSLNRKPGFFARLFGRGGGNASTQAVDSSQYAIRIQNLSKIWNPGKKKEVVAIRDLSLSIPRNGVYVVLAILNRVKTVAPSATIHTSNDKSVSFQLGTANPKVVSSLLGLVESEKQNLGIKSYDTHGTSLEEVFLSLMEKENSESEKQVAGDSEKLTPGVETSPVGYDDNDAVKASPLSDGRKTSVLSQALVICLKRFMVARRSFLPPILALACLLCASIIPLRYMTKRHESCAIKGDSDWYYTQNLYLPEAGRYGIRAGDIGEYSTVVSPFELTSYVGNITDFPVDPIPSGVTFNDFIAANYKNLSIGGLSLDSSSRQAVIAYWGEAYSLAGPALLNLASNIMLNQIENTSGPRIIAQHSEFPANFPTGTADALKWIGFFGLGVAVFPAFAALYVARERISTVKAMQLGNGLTPAAHHLGHLLAEMPVILIGSTVAVAVFGTMSNPQFTEPGLLWFLFVLYGISATLFSFLAALFLSSPLMAFAIVAVFNVVVGYILYLSAYLLTLTYAPPASSSRDTQIVHFVMGLLGPLPSLFRSVLVSLNVFSLRCDGFGNYTTDSMGGMKFYGGPILYFILYIVIFFSLLVWIDSGYPLPSRLSSIRATKGQDDSTAASYQAPDVAAERQRVLAPSNNDPLRVLGISKQFARSKVKAVDGVTFGVGGETVGLLGPNGAGKTTTFNMIRGGIKPDTGDVQVNGLSIREDTNGARVGLGLCPQFTAIDSQLTVREHLEIYGRLKGLRGRELKQNVATLLRMAELAQYRDRLASKLSGGNQRKMSLAIALMGNPSVLLIDEYSTGIDPATKRHMWATLKELSVGKAVLITTHSMEEAAYLSNRVAIISGRLLAIGTVEDLVSRHPMYEVHVSCQSPEVRQRAQVVLSNLFPDCRPADDVATRWEVPVSEGRTLSALFSALSGQDLPEYAVERLSLESVFLKTIRNNDAATEREDGPRRKKWLGLF
ncbi:hypothetical protein FS837_010632 [Tulasnella sp. UAMH 9824]|nr:hypothetical protein FS837_010632 [Tulasnella sp. UAMH 9824]